MFLKLLFYVCIGTAVGNTVPGYASFQQYQNYLELTCLSVGGICTESGDCPEGKQAPYRGLCLHKGRDAECCHSVPLSETRCRENGGECVPSNSQCPDFLLFKRATDCGTEEKCCIFTR